jgi:hypothetical protein
LLLQEDDNPEHKSQRPAQAFHQRAAYVALHDGDEYKGGSEKRRYKDPDVSQVFPNGSRGWTLRASIAKRLKVTIRT